MSRSESLACATDDERVAATTDRVPAGRGRQVGPDPVHRGRAAPRRAVRSAAPERGRPRAPARGRAAGRARPGRARRRAGPAAPRSAGRVRTCTPARSSSPGARSRAGSAESWLPLEQHDLRPGVDEPGEGLVEQRHGVDATAAPGRRRRRRPGRRRPRSARTTSTRWSTKAAWASSSPTRWNERPRCQSEVWRMRTARRVGRGHRRRARTWRGAPRGGGLARGRARPVGWSAPGELHEPWLGPPMGDEVHGRRLHARAAPAVPREGAPVPRRVRADAGPSSFDFERPLTGMEIELNLVDDDYQPRMANAAGAGGDRRPRLPDRARRSTTSSSTCRRARCRATPRSSSRTTCAPASTAPRTQANAARRPHRR